MNSFAACLPALRADNVTYTFYNHGLSHWHSQGLWSAEVSLISPCPMSSWLEQQTRAAAAGWGRREGVTSASRPVDWSQVQCQAWLCLERESPVCGVTRGGGTGHTCLDQSIIHQPYSQSTLSHQLFNSIRSSMMSPIVCLFDSV